MLRRKEHINIGKTIQLEEINQRILAKEIRLKVHQDKIKQYRQNRTFKNKERKFYKPVGRECTNT